MIRTLRVGKDQEGGCRNEEVFISSVNHPGRLDSPYRDPGSFACGGKLSNTFSTSSVPDQSHHLNSPRSPLISPTSNNRRGASINLGSTLAMNKQPSFAQSRGSSQSIEPTSLPTEFGFCRVATWSRAELQARCLRCSSLSYRINIISHYQCRNPPAHGPGEPSTRCRPTTIFPPLCLVFDIKEINNFRVLVAAVIKISPSKVASSASQYR